MTTTALNTIPMPNGRKIAEFVKRTTNSKNDYFKIIIEKYIDLWKLNRVPVTIYESRIKNGTLEPKIMEYLKKNYGYVNMLGEGVPRTYKYLLEKIKEKLKACFI